jgi:hypothetical protein
MFPINNNRGGAIIDSMRTTIDYRRIVPVIRFGNRLLFFNTFELVMKTVKHRADILPDAVRQYFAIQIEEVSRERIYFIEAVKHGLKQSYVYEVLQFYHAE